MANPQSTSRNRHPLVFATKTAQIIATMKAVKVYTADPCPYCDRAKALLRARSVPFEEIHVDRNDPEAWQSMIERSGLKTVPQIFIGDRCIGGYTDLAALDQSGEFLKLLSD
jgi:glutaredoxin 3